MADGDGLENRWAGHHPSRGFESHALRSSAKTSPDLRDPASIHTLHLPRCPAMSGSERPYTAARALCMPAAAPLFVLATPWPRLMTASSRPPNAPNRPRCLREARRPTVGGARSVARRDGGAACRRARAGGSLAGGQRHRRSRRSLETHERSVGAAGAAVQAGLSRNCRPKSTCPTAPPETFSARCGRRRSVRSGQGGRTSSVLQR